MAVQSPGVSQLSDDREVADEHWLRAFDSNLGRRADVHAKGMGHCSIYGHTHDILNPLIRETIESYR
jgi:hypothetical protein